MAYDLIIKNGTLIDGTGSPGVRGDVAIKDGKIAAHGRVDGPADRTIDADGQVVAPGIIDLHTHYDPQLTWEKLGTSSIWHGITTIMMGNCGLTLAPLRPQDREPMLQIFGKVEELSLSSLRACIPWNWETFGEYMDAIDEGLGLNVLPMVGHNALRLSVMGEAAGERAATADEIAQMQRLLRESLEAGAWGWSTTISPTHVGPSGEPVPSRLAEDEELIAFAQTLSEFDAGSIALIPRKAIFGLDEQDQSLLLGLAKTSGRPVVWNGYNYRWYSPRSAFNDLAYMEGAAKQGAQIYALLRVTPLDRWFSLKRTTYFNGLAVWRDLMDAPIEERRAAFADPANRPALRHAFDNPETTTGRGQVRPPIRPAALFVRRTALEKNQGLVGRSVVELAAEQGKHAVDVILDLALEENLETEFQAKMEMPEDEAPKGQLLQSLHALPYQSDAGAHVNSDCTAGESTYVLSHWVREKGVLSLEEAIRRMTSLPAQIAGLTDRGAIRDGLAADLMIFDPATIEALPKELVQDMPGGETRYIQRAAGISKVIVGGEVVLDEGSHTGALPGRVLRSR